MVLDATVPKPVGYEEREFAAAGTATAYRASGPLPTDGRFQLDASRLAARYPTKQAYLNAYRKAADAAIASGFVLADDRQALLADAQPDRIHS